MDVFKRIVRPGLRALPVFLIYRAADEKPSH
jgi:hypothetical protein